MCAGRFEVTISSSLRYFSLQPGVNGLYGRISYFRAWIEREMTAATFCGGTADAEASEGIRPFSPNIGYIDSIIFNFIT